MAQPFDALFFREAFGRVLRNRDTGFQLAYYVTPLTNAEEKDGIGDREFNARIEGVRRGLVDILDNGEIFYVNNEISHLLWDTAKQIPDTKLMHWEPGDFPTRTGYVYFDADLPLPTVLSRDGTQPLRALMWTQLLEGPGGPDGATSWLIPGTSSGNHPVEVVGKVIYTIVDNPLRWRNRLIERHMGDRVMAGKWCTRHWMPLQYDTRYDADMVGDLIDESDAEYLTEDERIEDNEGSREAIKMITKLLYVWCGFLQTEIYAHGKFDSSNHDKVVAREGRPPAQVRVITLRRYMSVPNPDAATVEVDWTHRWKVREHYRNQRVGPGRTFIRRTLVREHWKGPEDKPQAHQDTIQALVR